MPERRPFWYTFTALAFGWIIPAGAILIFETDAASLIGLLIWFVVALIALGLDAARA